MRDFTIEFLKYVKLHGKFTENKQGSKRVDLVWWDVSK